VRPLATGLVLIGVPENRYLRAVTVDRSTLPPQAAITDVAEAPTVRSA
jgi:hypothetical protein